MSHVAASWAVLGEPAWGPTCPCMLGPLSRTRTREPGHRVRHPIPRALSTNTHFPSASSVSCAETSRCHTARTDRSVQGSSSTRTARPVWATSSALTVCRCWHSSLGGSPSTLTITMFVSTVVRSTEQTGDASSWSPEPRSCGPNLVPGRQVLSTSAEHPVLAPDVEVAFLPKEELGAPALAVTHH
ncbi:hypothetical protein E2I00_002260 [Balaenoptera physalus]|uniref:Uncharacterized protein n=1 Tax=Balaenoptera physalus TaxID=9770 RepID=A0A643CHL6_BALPH|nr:hypothetical protein E2I00_002260 [Balaenoptera physalus]